MKIKENKQSDFIQKVTKGLDLCYKNLVQTKIEKNQSMVIMHNGKVITVKASELKNL
jgi:hypothetical protein